MVSVLNLLKSEFCKEKSQAFCDCIHFMVFCPGVCGNMVPEWVWYERLAQWGRGQGPWISKSSLWVMLHAWYSAWHRKWECWVKLTLVPLPLFLSCRLLLLSCRLLLLLTYSCCWPLGITGQNMARIILVLVRLAQLALANYG